MVTTYARELRRLILSVDSGDLIYVMPQTGEVVTYGEPERN